MNRSELIHQIRTKKNFLCVGLDPDISKMPEFIVDNEDCIFEFNKAIIDATAQHCVAYKPNTAFYEAYGLSGIESLEKTIKYIKLNYPHHFLIADAKRGDIGNTSTMYAKAFFNRLNADAITVAPYMGSDSVKPFLAFEGKWAIVLALTSNEGSADFQQQQLGNKLLFESVLESSMKWGNIENLMYVVGATKAEMLADIRKIIPHHFILVPGVGAQGGSLEDVCKYGLNSDVGLLVNLSRAIIYASSGQDFAEKAAEEALKIAQKMSVYL
ncbi:MAG: orotidine-5'-phosphate decarboxylase [Bacteroidetes bacterium]|nr:orotidine-5'-phosphate decarboxylase [Bacteroidota bacterium]